MKTTNGTRFTTLENETNALRSIVSKERALNAEMLAALENLVWALKRGEMVGTATTDAISIIAKAKGQL